MRKPDIPPVPPAPTPRCVLIGRLQPSALTPPPSTPDPAETPQQPRATRRSHHTARRRFHPAAPEEQAATTRPGTHKRKPRHYSRVKGKAAFAFKKTASPTTGGKLRRPSLTTEGKLRGPPLTKESFEGHLSALKERPDAHLTPPRESPSARLCPPSKEGTIENRRNPKAQTPPGDTRGPRRPQAQQAQMATEYDTAAPAREPPPNQQPSAAPRA